MSLPADICRCHDDSCAERQRCRRWLERATGDCHAASLNPYAIDSSDCCELRISILHTP